MGQTERQDLLNKYQSLEESDLHEIKVLKQIEEEHRSLGVPWRYFLDLGFFGFKIQTFTFYFFLIQIFVFTYNQYITFPSSQQLCLQIYSGGILPYLVLQHGQYWRIFTSIFVYRNYGHLFNTVFDGWFIFFITERTMKNWVHFAMIFLSSQVLGACCNIIFQQDVILVGNSSPAITITLFSFMKFWKDRKQLQEQKVFIVGLVIYLLQFVYQIFSDEYKIPQHIGALLFGILIQPFIFNMDYKLNQNGKLIYKIALIIFILSITIIVLFYPRKEPGIQTKYLFKKCDFSYTYLGLDNDI